MQTLLFNMCLCVLESESGEVRGWRSDLRCRATQTKLLSHNSNITYKAHGQISQDIKTTRPILYQSLAGHGRGTSVPGCLAPGHRQGTHVQLFHSINGKCNNMFKIRPVTFSCCV